MNPEVVKYFAYNNYDAVTCPNCGKHGYVKDCVPSYCKSEFVRDSTPITELHQVVRCLRCTALVTVHGMQEEVIDSKT